MPVSLISGLGGAIGGDYRSSINRLFFVEFDGKVSRLDLIPSASIIQSGTVTIPGTHTLDLDTGTLSGPSGQRDIWWQQATTTQRSLTPMDGATIHRIGAASFPLLSYPELLSLPYSATPIDGSVGSGNQLTPGTVVAVRTNAGNYAKLQVLSYGYDLQIRYTTYQVNSPYQVLGTGYQQPEDIVASADGVHAYVTERTGQLLRVNLSSADRTLATVVASGLTAPHQIALDEEHNQAYVVEHAPSGRLLRIDLTTGVATTLLSGLTRAVGLLVDADRTFAYVSEQGPSAAQRRVVRYRIDSGHTEVLTTGLTAPFFLRWTDPGETGILVAERDPANRITRIDLSGSPVTTAVVASGVPARPSSVVLISETDLLILSDQEISRLGLTESVFTPAGPILLGIGHVPADRISRSSPPNPARDGYADTTVDADYFFQVRDAPFGGTLPIMFNHTRAWSLGARYYKLFVDGVEPRQNWVDLRWSTSANRFIAQQVNPTATGYYRVRPPTELWYHHWLGYRLQTGSLGEGHMGIALRLYGTQNAGSEIGNAAAPGQNTPVQIDNTRPQLSIDEILHDGSPVGNCGIVDSGSDAFTFRITAHGARGHLLNWSLAALWGDNRSAQVDGDSYDNHASPSRQWAGVAAQVVPMVAPSPWHATVPGDPTSTRCAHTFRLQSWSRAIDGWQRLYHEAYHRSITIMLP